MRTETLRQDHLDYLRGVLQPMQAEFADTLEKNPDFARQVTATGPAIAFLDGDIVLGCAGLIIIPGTGRAVLWCGYARESGRRFAWIFKRGMKQLLEKNCRRVEAYIDPNFPQAVRLAKLAGFEREGLMRSFWGDGTDRELWARLDAKASSSEHARSDKGRD